MNISKVSFGKIVKVNAPYEIAKQIEVIANKEPDLHSNISKEVTSLFNDTKGGKARTFCMDKRISYIFSGEESKKYEAINNNLYEKLNHIQEHCDDKEEAIEQRKKAIFLHRESIMNLLNNAGISITVDPIYKRNKLKTLNTIM